MAFGVPRFSSLGDHGPEGRRAPSDLSGHPVPPDRTSAPRKLLFVAIVVKADRNFRATEIVAAQSIVSAMLEGDTFRAKSAI
jgi:hypothetical protein